MYVLSIDEYFFYRRLTKNITIRKNAKGIDSSYKYDRDTMNSEINRDFETSVNDSRKLQTIVDCAYMSALTKNQGCLNDCVYNLACRG